MSTKTSIKRIALVAVSALGFGLLSVVPAKAAQSFDLIQVREVTTAIVIAPDSTDNTLTDITTAPVATVSSVYSTANAKYLYMDPNAELASTGHSIRVDRLAAPAAEAAATTLPAAMGGAGSVISGAAAGDDPVSGFGKATDGNTNSDAFTTAANAAATVKTGFASAPVTDAAMWFWLAKADFDTAGSYTLRIYADADGSGSFTSGEVSQNVTFSVGGTKTTDAVSLSKSTVIGGDIVTITVSSTDGTRATIPSTDLVTLSNQFSACSVGTRNSGTSITLSVDYLAGVSRAICTVGTVGGLVATGTATTAALGAATMTFATGVSTAAKILKVAATNTTGISYASLTEPTGITTAAGTDTISVDPAVTTVSFVVTNNADQAGNYNVWEVSSSNTSRVSNTAKNVAFIGVDGKSTTFSVTNATPVAGDSYVVKVYGNGNVSTTAWATYTITYAKPVPKVSIISPATTGMKVVNGGTSSFKVRVRDIYGRVLASQPITVTVTGRNTLNATLTSDADGYATYSYTDAGTTAAATSDTVSFNSTNASGAGTAKTYTVSYITSAVAVGTVAISTSASTATVDNVQSDAAFNYPAASAVVTLKATVRKADGTPVGSGVLVTFAGASADDLFYDEVAEGVTDTAGEATVDVYRNKVGTTTFTATANGVASSASTPIKWSNTNTTDARYITVTSDPASAPSEGVIRITAKVTDRWGNPVDAVALAISENGAGRLYTGVAATGTTTSTGEFSWDMTSLADETGKNTVTVSVTSAGTQVENLADKVGTATVTGVTAGVKSASASIEFTKNTSVSTADALLELAKAIGTGKEVEAAADAAAEAIDAANAATDAANLAAEAADAATVAAEEARDAADAATAAVEELATQVATLMSALKAQLTTLANTVAKIAKKVKA